MSLQDLPQILSSCLLEMVQPSVCAAAAAAPSPAATFCRLPPPRGACSPSLLPAAAALRAPLLPPAAAAAFVPPPFPPGCLLEGYGFSVLGGGLNSAIGQLAAAPFSMADRCLALPVLAHAGHFLPWLTSRT